MNALRRRWASTRVRITVVSVVVVGIGLASAGLILHASLHRSSIRAVQGSAALQVPWVESQGASGTLPDPLPAVDASRLTEIQVIDAHHHVLAASSQLSGTGVQSDGDDDGDDDGEVRSHADDGDHHRLRGGPWYVDSASATVGGQPVTVVAYTSLSDYERALNSIDQALAVAFPMLLLLVAGATWWLVGRSLRPVEVMRREVDTITAGNLDSRVVEPPSADEVGRLAVTLNSMLERLELSANRQRRFIADASHELRTPVANVSAALEVATRYPDRADWPEVAGDVAAQNDRMARLVDDLLLMARTEHGQDGPPAEPVAVAAVVTAEVARLSPVAGVTVGIIEPLAQGSVAIGGRQLERVVANLLENAARHATGQVDVSVAVEAGTVTIAVADDGPGVPVEQRARVFEPFVRLDEHRARAEGGAGLGLAIVADLVASAGGTIAIEDGPSGGAVFVVRFPVALSA